MQIKVIYVSVNLLCSTELYLSLLCSSTICYTPPCSAQLFIGHYEIKINKKLQNVLMEQKLLDFLEHFY